MVEMYGIPNCDTIKKARNWLDENGVEYRFHDYKKEGADAACLKRWCEAEGWETLLNRRGTTWRKLADADKNGLDTEKVIALMVANPSMIKRPVLVAKGRLLVGFDADDYGDMFR